MRQKRELRCFVWLKLRPFVICSKLAARINHSTNVTRKFCRNEIDVYDKTSHVSGAVSVWPEVVLSSIELTRTIGWSGRPVLTPVVVCAPRQSPPFRALWREKSKRDFSYLLSGSILDTLRAASLTSDLILRGSRKKDAFVTALKQVYVRNQVSDRNKQVRNLSSAVLNWCIMCYTC